MIDSKKIRTTEQQLCTLMCERLGMSQPTLAKAVKRAGRRLPERQRKHAATVTEAVDKLDHPALFAQLDGAHIEKSAARLTEYLQTIDPKKQRMDRLVRQVSGLAFNLLVLAGAIIVLLRYRGYI